MYSLMTSGIEGTVSVEGGNDDTRPVEGALYQWLFSINLPVYRNLMDGSGWLKTPARLLHLL